jgi:hypothetical protein
LFWLICFHIKPTIIVGQIGFAVESLAYIYSRTNGHAGRVLLFRNLAAIGLANILIVILSGVLIDYWTQGLWKFNTIDAAAICKFDVGNLLTNIVLFSYGRHMTPYLMVLLFAAISLPRTVLFSAFWVTLTLECIMMLKQGSHPKYLAGSLVVWCLAAALMLTKYLRSLEYSERSSLHPSKQTNIGAGLRNFLSFILLPLLFSAQLQILRNGNYFYVNEAPPPSDYEISVMDNVLETYGEENVLVLAPFYALLRDSPYLFVDPYHAGILEDNDWINFNDEIEKFKKHRYKAIIADARTLPSMAIFRFHDADPFPKSLNNALKKYYRLADVEVSNSTNSEELILWVPKKKVQANE